MNVTDDELTSILEAVGWALRVGLSEAFQGCWRPILGAEGRGRGLTTTHPVRKGSKCKASLFNDRLSLRWAGKPQRRGQTAVTADV